MEDFSITRHCKSAIGRMVKDSGVKKRKNKKQKRTSNFGVCSVCSSPAVHAHGKIIYSEDGKIIETVGVSSCSKHLYDLCANNPAFAKSMQGPLVHVDNLEYCECCNKVKK